MSVHDIDATALPSLTILEFCAAEKISRGKYYELQCNGTGPDELRVAGLVRITPEAHARWRRKSTPTAKVARAQRDERAEQARRAGRAGVGKKKRRAVPPANSSRVTATT